jgi:argininosuccinate lyase
VFATLELVPDRMRAAADVETTAATDLAEHLVRQGMPFRDAHHVVGSLVREVGDGSLADAVAADDRFDAEVQQVFEPGAVVRRRTTPGGGGPDPVARQLEDARRRLAEQSTWLRV